MDDSRLAGAVAALFAHSHDLYRQSALVEAGSSLDRLLELDPKHFDALHLRGLIAAQQGRRELAVHLIQRAIAENASVAAAHRHLGNALRDLGRLEDALQSYGKAVQLRREFKETYVNRAMVFLLLGRPAEALGDFDHAIALGGDDAHVHTFRSTALIDLQRPADAVAGCDQALARQPDFPAALVNRAAARYLLGQYEQALADCERAIAVQGSDGDAHAHRGAALYALRRPAEAVASLDTAIALRPVNAFAHNVRALCLLEMQQPQRALESCERAIALRPQLADAYNTRGLALTEFLRFDESMASFDQAIALRPEVPEPYFNKGIRYLQAGDFERGWELYERRPKGDRAMTALAAGRPLWDGSQDIAGKTLFIYSEQGLGDTIQFCRYATLIAARGARVILAVQESLCSLLRGLGPGVEVVGWSESPQTYDFHCPLLTLPRALRTRLGDIPATVPYLWPQPARVSKWRERLGTHGRLIGIRWQGSTGRADVGRSFPVRCFEVLTRLDGVRLISLQKGPGAEQLHELSGDWQVEDLGVDFEPDGPDAFLDVAAVMECLELVITSDTSIAHLAGALGRPTWVALKQVPDWRWMLGREDSPWYPTLRLFRQERSGDWEAVFSHMASELRIRARTTPSPKSAVLVARGLELLGLRHDAEALACFERALSGSSNGCVAAALGKCRALMRLGHFDAALALADECAKDPTFPRIDGIRAQILLAAGRNEEAGAAAERGCARNPEDPAALLVRAVLLLERGDSGAALAAFDAALALDPAQGAAHQGRGSALATVGRIAEALPALESARQLDPNNALIPVRMGHLMIQLNQFDRALEAFTGLLDRFPDDIAALQGRAQCLAALGHAARAVDAYTRLLAVVPDADYMRGERFHAQMHCCDWSDFDVARRDIAARVRRGERADIPGSFLTHSESPSDQLICARTFAADVCAISTPRFTTHPQQRGDRVRVAYLSADFHTHATAFLAAGLFEAHDRSKFEIHAVSFGPADDSAMRRRLVRAFEHFHDVRHLSDQQIAMFIHELGIDIAVDLKGHTLGGRPRIFAFRPAPVQVSFLAYPGTLGADFMDYLIADRQVIPESERIHYAEQVIYLPGCYQVNDGARGENPKPSRRELRLPEAAFVFCCFNSSYKITPAVFADWLEILKAVPRSVLWLLEGAPSAVQNLRAEAVRGGVDPERLIFAPWAAAADHLARCALADLFLDTLPYNAHTTASDALWSGVPLVTRAGATFASRVATSVLHAVGLDALSVGSSAEYRALAVRIATSPVELQLLKETLVRARDRSGLFNSTWYCRQLEAAFAEIVARHRRGELPSPLELPAVSID